MLQEEWRITGVRISSRSTADVYFGDRTVRIPGEVMVDCFLADPCDMYWIEKEDREIWPWDLPEEKRKNRLSETETASVLETVTAFFRHRKEPIVFLTGETEDRALELAGRIKDKQISRRKAAALLKKAVPDLSFRFCRDLIGDALAGAGWCGQPDTAGIRSDARAAGNRKRMKP